MSEHVQETNDYSIASKLSMVTQGYFADPYIKYFCSKFRRRAPLINISYYVRAIVVKEGLNLFIKNIEKEKEAQIVSFGAGFDTNFFRLTSENPNIIYFEVDLRDVVKNKIECIKNSEELLSKMQNLKENEAGFISDKYRLISQDLRKIEDLNNALLKAGLDEAKPTLFLSECSLTYIDSDKSEAIMKYCAKFRDAFFLIYEQINPDDGFGTFMINHFEQIGNPLLSVSKFRSKQDQLDRFTKNLYNHPISVGAFELFKSVISTEELQRVINLEPFDEWEEWHLTSSHYTLSGGVKGIFYEPLKSHFTDLRRTASVHRVHTPIEWKVVNNNTLRFYGHSSVMIWNSSACLIVGGYGMSSEEKHKRLAQIHILTIADLKVVCVNPPSIDGVCWDCMYHSCTLLSDSSDESVFLLYGGRTSPLTAVNCTPVVVTVTKSPGDVIIKGRKLDFSSEDSVLLPRRRHSATNIGDGIIIFGGINSSPVKKKQTVLGDAWMLTKDEKLIKLSCDGPPRFSHSAVQYKGVIFVSGGMDSNFQPTYEILTYHLKENVWGQIEFFILPRYSHTSHIVDDILYLVGGVNDLTDCQPGITIYKLKENELYEYDLPVACKESPVMLHNHSSFLHSNQIIVVGGGGNCFSFGTSFNKCIIMIDLEFFKIK